MSLIERIGRFADAKVWRGHMPLESQYTVGIAGEKFLCVEHPTVLWLAPSNAIVNQTLAALEDRKHPYRQELDRRFGRD